MYGYLFVDSFPFCVRKSKAVKHTTEWSLRPSERTNGLEEPDKLRIKNWRVNMIPKSNY